MATLKLVLDTRRDSKENTYPLVFRIYAGNKARNLATGIKITENQFNGKNGEIVGDDVINHTLQNLKIDILRKQTIQIVY
jgi:hypothetical protein